MANILVLALGAAFYPTLLAIVIVVLSRPRPVRLLAAYLAGGLLVSLGAGFIIVFGLKGAGVESRNQTSEWSAIVDIVGGTLALALALLLVTGHEPRPARLKRTPRRQGQKKQSWAQRTVGRDSLKVAFGLGIVLDLPSVWYLIALKDIASGDYTTGGRIALILVFNLIMFMVIEVPLIAYLVAPERAGAAVERVNTWIQSHVRQITEGVAAALGTYLVVRGVSAL